MTELNSLERDALHLVSLAKKAGADSCDVVVVNRESLSVGVREGKLENSNRSESASISLRVICDQKVATVNANLKDGMERLAERAVAMAKVSPEDPYQGLPDREKLVDIEAAQSALDDLDLYDGHSPDADAIQSLALEAEAGGLSVKGIEKSIGANSGWGATGFVLATSDDFSASFRSSGFSVSASMVAGSGETMERDYDFDSAIHFEDLGSAREIGISAGERAVRRLNPRQVASGNYPIIFDRRNSAGILRTLGSAINGASIARKTSFLREKLGEQVCKNGINIVDDPRMKRRGNSQTFDGEGVDSQPIKFIDDGVLTNWLLDSATARELGLETNGRANRAGSGTAPGTTNFYLENGNKSPEEMIAAVGTGLYLTETIGHGINMVTGDYSKGAAGFWIENGEVTYPVAEITIAGNLLEIFANMEPANDLEFKYGVDAPTLLIEGMTVGGK